MLIEYMKEAYPNFQVGVQLRAGKNIHSNGWQEQLPEVHDLQEFYKDALADVEA